MEKINMNLAEIKISINEYAHTYDPMCINGFYTYNTVNKNKTSGSCNTSA
jgi:hypothetical protein